MYKTVCFGLLLILSGLFAGAAEIETCEKTSIAPPGAKVEPNPFDGERAYRYLQDICKIGPRISGSEGMVAQQKLVAEHFEKLGGKVSFQRFRARHPLTGDLVPMANLIVQWHPERKQRILLAAHYDTRPLPDRDPDERQRREGKFIGANDGASGVALLMELGSMIPGLKTEFGIDFVLFDGEELIFDPQRDPYFLGSEWFARQYVAEPPAHVYQGAIVVDMIGDRDLEIFQEQNTMSWPESQPLATSIWNTAERLGVKEFVAKKKHTLRDDHLMLRNVGKIPSCVLIDFDYPAWHTVRDVPNQCSSQSLAKVGWVLLEWLKEAKPNKK